MKTFHVILHETVKREVLCEVEAADEQEAHDKAALGEVKRKSADAYELLHSDVHSVAPQS
jgi:hypothetical protein